MARVAYADPPYPGWAKYYPEKTEVPSAELIARLQTYDGWLLHTHSNALREIVPLLPKEARIMAWVKPFAAFKKNVSVAYAWEPVIVKAARKPLVIGRIVMRDWIAASSTLQKGLVGAKPMDVCLWAFDMLGMDPDDELDDLYPGTGAVTAAWGAWREMRRKVLAPVGALLREGGQPPLASPQGEPGEPGNADKGNVSLQDHQGHADSSPLR